jgi:3-oxoadipate enol-lactonase
VTLPYSEQGDGPSVLLLHAGIADRRMWDEHLEPLAAAGHRVVAVDLPGFGEAVSMREPVAHWEDVVETMNALEIAHASLVGNSFGGAVALRVAALHPQRVSSLFLFSAGAAPEPDPSLQLLAAWDAEEEALAAGDLEKAVQATVSSWIRPEASAEVRKRIATMQLENYQRHASEQLEHAADPLEDDPELVATIGCPALLAAGESDMVDFKNAVGELAAKLPRVTTNLIADCGHLAPLEAPEEFRRLVLEKL